MVSLDKTTHSIQYGRYRAHVNAALRQNNLIGLSLWFGERIHDAEVKAFEEYKAAVLAR
ncbi:hypothetical protein [Streptomyces sp. NPDC046805]|uniref:hypothetical protein n=1 Tax=Streptomyces sp. NPDC046805 TaxID=3155134 RepID=UPI0033FB93DE